MPLYEYECEKCHEVFDELRSVSEREEPIACPTCSGRGHVVISGFAQGASGGSSPGGACSTGEAACPLPQFYIHPTCEKDVHEHDAGDRAFSNSRR